MERSSSSPFSIISALARDEDTAEGSPAKNHAFIHVPSRSYFADCLVASSCGTLSQAILGQSGAAVELAIRKFPDCISERNILGQTPLHLAVLWPYGVARLLEAGADVNAMDNHSLTPMLYASIWYYMEAVQQLLDAGSALRSHIHQGHSGSVRSALEFALTKGAYRTDIIETLIEALSARRKRLLELATELLSVQTIVDLHISHGRLLDERTSDVYDALTAISPALPAALQSHPRELGTVYHMKELNPEVADRLFDTGFRDIEGYNARGLTPIMALEFEFLFKHPNLTLFSWFVSKGASLLTLQRNEKWSALHFIAAQFGAICSCHWCNDASDPPSAIQGRSINGISYAIKQCGGPAVVLRTSDHCSCACSTSGCTMIISALKAFSLYAKQSKPDEPCIWTADSYVMYVDFWMSLVAIEPILREEMIKDILRLVLFEKLCLSHTCCWWWHDQDVRLPVLEDITSPEDGAMIQHEEVDMIKELADLLGLALSRWQDFSGPLSEFIKQFIVEEVDHNTTDWGKDYVREVEDLGVKLERSFVD